MSTTLTETDLAGLYVVGQGQGTAYRISLYRCRAGGLRLRIERRSCRYGSPGRRVVTYPWSDADSGVLQRAADDAADAGTDAQAAIDQALYEVAEAVERNQAGRIIAR